MSRWPITWYDAFAEKLDRKYGWDKLPLPVAMLVLIGLRNVLREKNLYDTGRGPLDKPNVDDHPRYLTARTLDGTYNDLEDPLMGSLGSRFGRNVPLEYTVRTEKNPLEPNPRTVSRELLTREEFIPATTLNLLAGAWIQFEVHDWFSHGQNEEREPLEDRARGRRSVAAAPDGDPADAPRPERRIPMGRRPSSPPTRTGGTARRSTATSPAFAQALRTGENGKLKLDDRGPASAGGRGARRPHGRSRQLLGRARAAALALHARAQRVCDHLHATYPEIDRRRALRQRAPRHRGADGEDPHGRLDAGDHRAPDDRAGAARELVGRGRRALDKRLRPRSRGTR